MICGTFLMLGGLALVMDGLFLAGWFVFWAGIFQMVHTVSRWP